LSVLFQVLQVENVCIVNYRRARYVCWHPPGSREIMGRRDNTIRDVATPVDQRRRQILCAIAASFTAALGVGTLASLKDNSDQDTDQDGLPDALEQSPQFHRKLETVFGEEIETLDPDQKDLLIDTRYIGATSISDEAKEYLRELFHNNGINLQWLDYPARYDLEMVREKYGMDVESILFSPNGFYWSQIEPFLRNVAFQLIVAPGRKSDPAEGQIYCQFYEDYVSGMNFGNRAVVTQRDEPADQAALALHEIAHLVLCHDPNPNNSGPMGQETEIDLTEHEWEQFRDNLDNIRDSTGIGVVFRRCLVEDYSDGSVEK
jgi:hypothetical protein